MPSSSSGAEEEPVTRDDRRENDSSEPASMLILFSPGAPREAYFDALAENAAGRRFSEEAWQDLCRRHDNDFV